MINKGINFALPSQTSVLPAACAGSVFSSVSIPKTRVCPARPLPGLISHHLPNFEDLFRTSPPSTPIRRPDWFRLAGASTQLAAVKPLPAATCLRTGAASDGPLPATAIGDEVRAPAIARVFEPRAVAGDAK